MTPPDPDPTRPPSCIKALAVSLGQPGAQSFITFARFDCPTDLARPMEETPEVGLAGAILVPGTVRGASNRTDAENFVYALSNAVSLRLWSMVQVGNDNLDVRMWGLHTFHRVTGWRAWVEPPPGESVAAIPTVRFRGWAVHDGVGGPLYSYEERHLGVPLSDQVTATE